MDDIVRTYADGKTIGLIICKEKNNLLTKYVINGSKQYVVKCSIGMQ